ncbi:MAG: hypothetical protein FJ297_07020 [Planctomycetes bacterium]|nr:hypothetical protein [Planctomycetota bacterium]
MRSISDPLASTSLRLALALCALCGPGAVRGAQPPAARSQALELNGPDAAAWPVPSPIPERPLGDPSLLASPRPEVVDGGPSLPTAPRPEVVDGGPVPPGAFCDESVTDEFDDTSRITWVIGHRDGLGWFSMEDQGVLGYWGRTGWSRGLGYSIHFLDGPRGADLPPRLYGFHYGARFRDTVTDHFSYEVAVAPGIYSDFEDSARDGIRVQGHGFAMWTFETLQFVLGVDYLDRDTVKLLPVAGCVWAPDEATRFDLVFPRPRVARLVDRGPRRDRWFYVSGEYGGESWAIERSDTLLADVATLNETRVAFGIESVWPSGRASVLECAIHVDRELLYRSGAGDFRPKDTVGFRLGSRF